MAENEEGKTIITKAQVDVMLFAMKTQLVHEQLKKISWLIDKFSSSEFEREGLGAEHAMSDLLHTWSLSINYAHDRLEEDLNDLLASQFEPEVLPEIKEILENER